MRRMHYYIYSVCIYVYLYRNVYTLLIMVQTSKSEGDVFDLSTKFSDFSSASGQFQGGHFCDYMDVPPKIVG